jgi:hypothetical protein
MRSAPAVWLLAGSCVAAAGLVLFLTRADTFYYDEWAWFSDASKQSGHTLFQSGAGHLVVLPQLLYQAVLNVFGPDYLVFRLINTSLVLTNSVLLFLLARRRVGDWLALAPAIVMMFLGCSWDDLLAGVGTNENMGIAFGLGAFLALQRRTLGGDLLAGALVTAGFASFSTTFAVAVGGVVLLVAEGRWRRVWVMVVPILLFMIWSAQAGSTSDGQVTIDHLGNLPYAMFGSASTLIAGLTGMFPTGFPGGLATIDITVGWPLATLAISILIGYLLWKKPRLTPRFLAYATVVLVFWAMLGAAGRDTTTAHYLNPAAPFAFLALFELVAGHRVELRHWVIIGVLLGSSLLANLVALRNGAAILKFHAAQDHAMLAALELAKKPVLANPSVADSTLFELSGFASQTEMDLFKFTPRDYFRSVEQFGRPGYPPSDLRDAPEFAREPADRILYNVLAVSAESAPPLQARHGGCRTLRSGESSSASIDLPPQGLAFRASTADALLRLRRFADVSAIPPIPLPVGSTKTLSIPTDSLPQPWIIEISSPGPVVACPTGRAAEGSDPR